MVGILRLGTSNLGMLSAGAPIAESMGLNGGQTLTSCLWTLTILYKILNCEYKSCQVDIILQEVHISYSLD